MPARHASVPHARGPRHARRLRSRTVLRGVALGLSAALLFGFSAVGALGQRLDSNLDKIDVASLLGPAPTRTPSNGATTPAVPTDPNAGNAINILVLGSDQRDGQNAAIGGGADEVGMRSDTAIVVHVSADRDRVEMVSIPRDSLVDIPSCTMSNGKTTPKQPNTMFNKAFATGWDNGGDLASAAACTGRTVQDNTGLTIHHFVVIDFVGFESIVNAIGGVDICIPRDLHDDYTHLDLRAGQQTLSGKMALRFARARHGNVGNGGDLDRIGNQQRLAAAIANQVLSRDVLANPTKLTGFLSAATDSLTVDNGLSLVNLTGIAYSLRSVRSSDVTLMTIPVRAAPSDRNRLVWTQEAATVWANMVADQPIAPKAAPAATAGAPTPGATGTPTAPTPGETRKAGYEAFTGADVTATCS